jgi:hypothetical protein
MTGMPNTNPLSAIAHDSIGLAKDTGDKKFQLFALVAMGISGLLAIMHSAHMIYRDLRPKREKEHDKPERSYQPSRPAEYDDEPSCQARDDAPERSWVSKARLAERSEGGKRSSEDSGPSRQVRQH